MSISRREFHSLFAAAALAGFASRPRLAADGLDPVMTDVKLPYLCPYTDSAVLSLVGVEEEAYGHMMVMPVRHIWSHNGILVPVKENNKLGLQPGMTTVREPGMEYLRMSFSPDARYQVLAQELMAKSNPSPAKTLQYIFALNRMETSSATDDEYKGNKNLMRAIRHAGIDGHSASHLSFTNENFYGLPQGNANVAPRFSESYLDNATLRETRFSLVSRKAEVRYFHVDRRQPHILGATFAIDMSVSGLLYNEEDPRRDLGK